MKKKPLIKMKLFLLCLLVAVCQAVFDKYDYEVAKEIELKDLVKVAEEEIFKGFKKEYPEKDEKMLREVSHQLALFIKSEVDFSLSLMENSGKLAVKLIDNMWKNLAKAKAGGVEEIEKFAKDFLKDLTHDMDALKEHNKNNLHWEDHFSLINDVLAYKLEYGIWDKLNDTLHRVIGHLNGKFSDLKDFFKKSIKVGAEKLQPHLVNIKKLAKDVLANIGLVSRNVAQQSIDFFKPFAKQLGDLYVKLLEKIHARFHDLAQNADNASY